MLSIKLCFQIRLECGSETNGHVDLLVSLLPRLPFKRCRPANFRFGSKKKKSNLLAWHLYWPGPFMLSVGFCLFGCYHSVSRNVKIENDVQKGSHLVPYTE